ncbi:MAG: hypothetical protein LWX11_08085 [Firmicutes bacterium]|nr:hypothetical protein [Bacillota bacterium]
MNTFQSPVIRTASTPARQVEGEGILRMILLALALVMPLATMAYLKIQETRLGYEMSDIRARIKQEEELNRRLMLERSRFQRDEVVQSFANENGMQPRRQSHLIHRRFTVADQLSAKNKPVASFE